MNVILNSNMTLKNVVSVDETTARDSSCPIDILDTDIFVEDAPPIPDGMHTPKLLADGSGWIEADQAAADAELLQREADAIRAVRKPMLEEADHIVNTLEDIGQDATAWRAYRQALRDITLQAGFPDAIDWPTKPR